MTREFYSANRPGGNPNDYADQYASARFFRTHQLVVSRSLTLPFGIPVSGIYRGFSGVPLTPRYGSDITGSGEANNRLYVPTDAEVADYLFFNNTAVAGQDSASQRTLFQQTLASNDCLSSHRGAVIGRNSCRNSWQHALDARLTKTLLMVSGQHLKISADFFNLLNGWNRTWGQRFEVQQANEALLSARGFNRAAGR
ncbi:MAG: hypothetical protein NVS1B4_00280 [Gemmatimonadaceae bacterium]